MRRLFSELKRRKVYGAAAMYAAAAWLLVQVSTQVAPYFDIPNSPVRALIVTLAIAFPFVLVLSWFYDLTPQGLRRDSRDAAVALDAAGAALVTPSDQSIAVLPFADMSENSDQRHFSDGLAEELLNLLAQVPQLKVIARTSSFSFKGKDADITTIAAALNVAHVLEGSVRKSGDALRVTAQLIRAADSTHVWSRTFDLKMTDVFAVQDQIAGAVVSALKMKLLPYAHTDSTRRTSNAEAYEQYLLGLDVLRHGRHADYRHAQPLFQRSIALDPAFAPAWVGLATTQSIAADFAGTIAQRFGDREAALASAERAIALAPELADGYVIRGQLRHRQHWDWRGGIEDLERALALDPNRSEVLCAAALGQYCVGDPEQALALARRATTIDPLSWQAWTYCGLTLFQAARADEACKALRRALQISPQASIPRAILGAIELLEGRYEQALEHYMVTSDGHRQAGIACATHSLGRHDESTLALAELETKYAWGFSLQIAEVHAWRGEADAAFAWLDHACERRDSGIPRLLGNWLLAAIKDDQRYTALVRRLGLPDQFRVSTTPLESPSDNSAPGIN